MSHFSVLVMIDPKDFNEVKSAKDIEFLVDSALSPYTEQEPDCDDIPDYFEFVEDDDFEEIDPKTGKKGYWANPNAKWDWYCIGGRWAYGIPLKDGTHANIARVGDISHDYTQDELDEAVKFWDGYVLGLDSDFDDTYEIYKPKYYLDRYKNIDTYVKCTCGFATYAVVDTKGNWLEPGEMGWWGLSNESDEDAVEWESGFKDRFLTPGAADGIDKDTVCVLVDCHI